MSKLTERAKYILFMLVRISLNQCQRTGCSIKFRKFVEKKYVFYETSFPAIFPLYYSISVKRSCTTNLIPFSYLIYLQKTSYMQQNSNSQLNLFNQRTLLLTKIRDLFVNFGSPGETMFLNCNNVQTSGKFDNKFYLPLFVSK